MLDSSLGLRGGEAISCGCDICGLLRGVGNRVLELPFRLIAGLFDEVGEGAGRWLRGDGAGRCSGVVGADSLRFLAAIAGEAVTGEVFLVVVDVTEEPRAILCPLGLALFGYRLAEGVTDGVIVLDNVWDGDGGSELGIADPNGDDADPRVVGLPPSILLCTSKSHKLRASTSIPAYGQFATR